MTGLIMIMYIVSCYTCKYVPECFQIKYIVIVIVHETRVWRMQY